MRQKGWIIVKKSTLFLLCSTMLILGTVLGFLLAPIKKGVYIGNNNGNTNCGAPKDADKIDSGDEEDMPF